MMGFSLLEMLITVAVITILLAAGAPSLQATAERAQITIWNERLMLLLQQRKAYAMAEHRAITINTEQLAAELPRGLRLSHNFRTGSPPVFEGVSGFARAGSLQLSNAHYTTKIIISGLGRIRTCQRSGPRLAALQPC